MKKRGEMEASVKNAPQGLFLLTHLGAVAATVVKKREKMKTSVKNAPQGLFFDTFREGCGDSREKAQLDVLDV